MPADGSKDEPSFERVVQELNRLKEGLRLLGLGQCSTCRSFCFLSMEKISLKRPASWFASTALRRHGNAAHPISAFQSGRRLSRSFSAGWLHIMRQK